MKDLAHVIIKGGHHLICRFYDRNLLTSLFKVFCHLKSYKAASYHNHIGAGFTIYISVQAYNISHIANSKDPRILQPPDGGRTDGS